MGFAEAVQPCIHSLPFNDLHLLMMGVKGGELAKSSPTKLIACETWSERSAAGSNSLSIIML